VRALAILLALLASGCGMLARREPPPAPPAPQAKPEAPPAAARPGGYYKDDGPGANPPADLAAIPDAVPRAEPLHRYANRPYRALGRDYVPLASAAGFRQRGRASWYGRRYHGQKTSSGEPYDMYAMSAAHPVLPIPSYARVTNPANGRSVVVRVNDRGPFHADRVIDLSYVAAWKLDIVRSGSALVEVESVAPADAVPAPAPAPAAEAGGVYVQLGAFAARASAEGLRARLARELAWLPEAIEIAPSGALYRVRVGPFRSREDAQPVAERIQAELDLQPLIVAR